MIRSLVILVLFCGTVTAGSCRERSPVRNSDSEVDYLLFVQQWAPGFCMSERDCKIPDGDPRWTIHGVWPTTNNSEGPNYCSKNPFDINKISDLLPTLNMSWPDLLTDSQFYCLWEHEWDKHGTCASSVAQLDGEHNYFNGAVQIRSNMDFYKCLDAAGITPSQTNTYKEDEIRGAFRKIFAVDPILQCYHHEDGSFILYQVAFCLSKESLTVFQCGEYAFKENTCPSGEDITYLMWQ